jgi:DNA-directed RNA polymerase specialized sigma subunit
MFRVLSKPADSTTSESSPLLNAIRQTTSTLPSREALVVRMWFESGMTTQKIATVLGMGPSDVHAVIAKRTDGVQHRLAQPQISSRTIVDSEESS